MDPSEFQRRRDLLARAAIAAGECRKCAIGYERRNNVYGEGDPCARLMVVGEGPGETEDELGRPFVGRAGQLLDRMLAAIALPRADSQPLRSICAPVSAIDSVAAAISERIAMPQSTETSAIPRCESARLIFPAASAATAACAAARR